MQFTDIKIILFICLIIIIIDVPVLIYVNKDTYLVNFRNINNGEIDFTRLKIISALICYLIMAFGLYYFSVKEKNILNALILGFVINGIYNTTNYATINKYSLNVAIIDTLWGPTLFTTVAYLVINLLDLYKIKK
jgi:uncharacterized membrane protein